jgi:hypothetical protein
VPGAASTRISPAAGSESATPQSGERTYFSARRRRSAGSAVDS